MEIKYIIRSLPADTGRYAFCGEFDPKELPAPWAQLEEAELSHFPWADADHPYRPHCFARVGWNENGLHVLMYAEEKEIRAEETEIGGMICRDSCLEFFLSPHAENPLYFNCEVNPKAVMHIGVGDGRNDRKVFHVLPEGFDPTASVHQGRFWAISYTVPASFLKEEFNFVPVSGALCRGNFYKCGDNTRQAHYGMFEPYGLARADYHRPELFAGMMLE